jgi:hypothetical protein
MKKFNQFLTENMMIKNYYISLSFNGFLKDANVIDEDNVRTWVFNKYDDSVISNELNIEIPIWDNYKKGRSGEKKLNKIELKNEFNSDYPEPKPEDFSDMSEFEADLIEWETDWKEFYNERFSEWVDEQKDKYKDDYQNWKDKKEDFINNKVNELIENGFSKHTYNENNPKVNSFKTKIEKIFLNKSKGSGFLESELIPENKNDISFHFRSPLLKLIPSNIIKIKKIFKLLVNNKDFYTNDNCEFKLYIKFPELSNEDMLWIITQIAMDSDIQRKFKFLYKFDFHKMYSNKIPLDKCLYHFLDEIGGKENYIDNLKLLLTDNNIVEFKKQYLKNNSEYKEIPKDKIFIWYGAKNYKSGNNIKNMFKFIVLLYYFLIKINVMKTNIDINEIKKKEFIDNFNNLSIEEKKEEPKPIQDILKDIVLTMNFRLTDDFLNKYEDIINNQYTQLSKLILKRLALAKFPFSISARQHVNKILK